MSSTHVRPSATASPPRGAPGRRRLSYYAAVTVVSLAIIGVSFSLAKRRLFPHYWSVEDLGPIALNAGTPPGSVPDGMVWIPGGEFSMGAADPTGADQNVVGMHATNDSGPIHRVYVDGFWMDKTVVTRSSRHSSRRLATSPSPSEHRTRETTGALPVNLVASSVAFFAS